MGVAGSIFLCWTMAASLAVFSGELNIPKTSASASLVLIVTVGSAPPIILLLRAAPILDEP